MKNDIIGEMVELIASGIDKETAMFAIAEAERRRFNEKVIDKLSNIESSIDDMPVHQYKLNIMRHSGVSSN